MRRTVRDPAGIFTPATAFLAVLFGVLALALLYGPIAGLAILSFSERPLTAIPWPLTLDWYAALFEGDNDRWIGPLVTSIMIGLVVSALSTTVAVVIGRSLPLIRRKGGLLVAYLSILVLPGILVGIAILFFYRGLLEIRTGFWSVVLVHFAWALPFALLCVLIVAVRFDHRLLEAAKDLGAGPLRRFVDIELPLLQPGIVAAAFFSFLLSFNELPRTLYVRGGTSTLPYYIWTASSSHSSAVPLIYALSAIIMAISFVLVLIAARILMRER